MTFLDTRKQRAAALIVGLGVVIALALLPFAAALLGAAVLYVICAPAHRRLSRALPPRLSAAVVMLGALVLILLPIATIVGLALEEAPATLRRLQEDRVFERMSGMRVGGVEVGARVAEAGEAVAGWVSAQAVGFFGSATRGLLGLVIAFFGLYYLLMSPGVVWASLRGFLPFSDATAERLRVRFLLVTQATLIGTLLTAVIQGTIVGVSFWALGLRGAVFWGFITALVSVLPVMGSALVWLPGVAVLAMDGRVGAAGLLLAIGLAAGSVDNLVRLVVFRVVSDIHPMVTLVGAFAGLRYLGLLGVLVGPLAIAYFFELLRMYREEYVAAPAPEGDASALPPGPAQPATLQPGA